MPINFLSRRGAFNQMGLDTSRYFPLDVCNLRLRRHKGMKGFGFFVEVESNGPDNRMDKGIKYEVDSLESK